MAGLAGLDRARAAVALVGAAAAGPDRRSDAVEPPHAARARRRRDTDRRTAVAQDARAPGPARCIRGLLPELLHHVDQLLLFPVAAHGGGHAGGADGSADGAGQQPHAGGKTAIAGSRPDRRHHGAAGRADHGAAVPAVPAAGAAVGHTGRRHERAHRAVGQHAGRQHRDAGAGRWHRHAHPFCGSGAAPVGAVLSRAGIVYARGPRMAQPALRFSGPHAGPGEPAHRRPGSRLPGDTRAQQSPVDIRAGRGRGETRGTGARTQHDSRAAVARRSSGVRPAALPGPQPHQFSTWAVAAHRRTAGLPGIAARLQPAHDAVGCRFATGSALRRRALAPDRRCARTAAHRGLRLHTRAGRVRAEHRR